jgi:hypothetical protein
MFESDPVHSKFLQYAPGIQRIIRTSDINTISAREIRKAIEREYGVNFDNDKQQFDSFTKDLFVEFLSSSENMTQTGAKPEKEEVLVEEGSTKAKPLSPKKQNSTSVNGKLKYDLSKKEPSRPGKTSNSRLSTQPLGKVTKKKKDSKTSKKSSRPKISDNTEEVYQPDANSDGEYEVERILDVRDNGAGKEYLIKWLGWEDEYNEWIPEVECFAPDLIKDFEERSNRHRRKSEVPANK